MSVSMARPPAMRLPQLGVLGAVFAALLVSRRPAALLHAQLWGDDGFAWYPDAYRFGLRCLLMPANGYLNTLQRLVALAVQPLPLRWVPTVFCLAALLVQIAPSLLLASDRMRRCWPNDWARLAFACILVGLPDLSELFLNLTNAQWHLGLLAFMVTVSAPPLTRPGWAFDGAVLLVSGLSGPFGVLLLPIGAWQLLGRLPPRRWLLPRHWRDAWSRDAWSRDAGGRDGGGRDAGGRGAGDVRAGMVRLGLLAAAALIQMVVYAGTRQPALPPLGAGPRMLARVLALKVLVGTEFGYVAMAPTERLAAWNSNLLPVAITLAATLLAACALLLGPRLLRQFCLFATLVMIGGLARPHVSATMPQWRGMLYPLAGNRYFWLESIAWVGVLFALAAQPRLLLRVPAGVLLFVLVYDGIRQDWHTIDWAPDDFAARARLFDAAPAGTTMYFPIVPTGMHGMTLTKR